MSVLSVIYNSPVENCVVVCRTAKHKARRGKILFINAVHEVKRERAQSFLTDEHLKRVVRAHQDFKDEAGFKRVASVEQVRANEGNFDIPLYIESWASIVREDKTETHSQRLSAALSNWLESSSALRQSFQTLLTSTK